MLKNLLLIVVMIFSPVYSLAQSLPDPAFQKRVASDIKSFGILRSNLKQAYGFARSRPDLFSPARDKKNALLSREEKLAIWNTWSSVLDGIAGLDGIRREHKKFNLFQDSERRNASFAIANASFLAGYRHALEFIALGVCLTYV